MIHDPIDPNDPAGGPAFPLYLGVYAGTAPPHIKGMSLRDYFAGQALMGQASQPDDATYKHPNGMTLEDWRKHQDDLVAQYCYRLADAMLAARKVKPEVISKGAKI